MTSRFDPKVGRFKWRTRRAWRWFAAQCYASGLISSYWLSGSTDGWIVHHLHFGWGRRPYVLWIKPERWGDPLHRLKFGHWPQRIQPGICGVCAPWPCCGATGYDHLLGCDGDF